MTGILQNKDLPVNIIKTLCLLWLLLNHVQVMAEDDDFVDNLVQRARLMQLSEKPGWLQLLHYRPHVFGGLYSQADDRAFFMAPGGKFDAAAELEASLRGLFVPPASQPHGNHAQCRFPARLHWLDAHLSFRQALPETDCQAFRQWRHSLDADSVTLVFPSMYLNNPASMFGHTFLRLDREGRSPLLSYALSYAAETDPGDSALVYVYRGLSGAYPGKFSVQPYYETVRTYGDIEHRDIWEYSLRLSAQQVEQLVRHAWEIRNIRFDYYFLRENCSYRLLTLLDVAQGDAPLVNRHPVYAIPVDTVRSIEHRPGISAARYRPAISSRLQQMYAQLPVQQQKFVMDVLQRQPAGFDMQQYTSLDRARMLDFMIEYVAWDDTVDKDFSEQLLLMRSRINLSDQPVFSFSGDDPRDGHKTTRWQLGAGDHEDVGYGVLGVRLAMHDLLDPPHGFLKGAAISVLDTRLRYYEQDELRIEAIDFFSIQSFSQATPWHSPLSAEFGFSMARDRLRNDNIFSLSSGVGYSTGTSSVLLYALVHARIDNYQTPQSSASFYMGARMGALWLIDESSRMTLRALHSRSVNERQNEIRHYELQYQYDFDRQNALRLQLSHRQRLYSELDDVQLSFLRYF